MKPAIGIVILSQEFQIVIAFNKDKIRIDKIFQQILPPVKIRGNGGLYVLMLNNKTIRRIERIVWDLKRLESQISHFESPIGKRLELPGTDELKTIIEQLKE